MSIIINNSKTVDLALQLETTIRSRKFQKPLLNGIKRNADGSGNRNSGKRIVNIVLPGYPQSNLTPIFPLFKKSIGRTGIMIIGNKVCRIVRIVMAKGNNLPSGEILQKILFVRNILVKNQDSVFRQLLNELTEGRTNVIDILKEIKVILFNV